MSFASNNDIGIVNGSPIAAGRLSGIEPDISSGTPEDIKAHQLWQWSIENNLNLLNLAVQFCLLQPLLSTSLTGSRNVIEVEQNVNAAITPVPDNVWEQVEKLM